MENNDLKPLTLKQSIKFGISFFLFSSILFIGFILVVTKGVTWNTKMIKPLIYALILFASMISIGILIAYKKRNDKTFTKKIITFENPLLMVILSKFGVKFNESNPREFYFYNNLIFGISLIVLSFIFIFPVNHKIALIFSSYGVFTIIWGILKRK